MGTLVSVAVSPAGPGLVRTVDRAGQGVETQEPRAVAFGDRDRGRDRGVTAEGHLRLGAEVPDPVLPGPARRLGERGLGIADPGSDRQARGVVQARGV